MEHESTPPAEAADTVSLTVAPALDGAPVTGAPQLLDEHRVSPAPTDASGGTPAAPDLLVPVETTAGDGGDGDGRSPVDQNGTGTGTRAPAEPVAAATAEQPAVDPAAQLWEEIDRRVGALEARVVSRSLQLEATREELDDVLARSRPGEVVVVRQQLQVAEQELTRLRRHVGDLEREVEALRAAGHASVQEELARLRAQLAAAREHGGAQEVLRQQVRDLEQRNRELETLRERYEAHQDAYERDATLREENDALVRRNARLREEYDRVAADHEEKRRDAESWKTRFIQANQSLKEQRSELRRLEIDLATLRAEREPKEAELADLRAREEGRQQEHRALLQSLQRDFQQRERDREAYFANYQERVAARVVARVESEDAESKRQAEAEIAAARVLVASLEEQLRVVRADRDRALKRDGELVRLEAEIERKLDTRRRDVRAADEECQRLEGRREALEARLDSLSEELRAALEDVHAKADARHRELMAEQAKLEGDVAALVSRREELKALVANDKEELERQRAERNAQLRQLDERIDAVLKHRLELEKNTLDREERVRSIYMPVFTGDGRLRRGDTEANERAWLESVVRGIKREGFEYPRRLVESFHTSLKIAEWAPLTMLAGVSGTGKSELPRLYSHVGGLHHLLVPVQPNWDSPQDLFGFFNYMDGRYRATPLLRALVQSQQPRDQGGLDDSLVLVLLDEMNLARVELYFSEMLSRLEARRGADPRERQQHMPVDIGAGLEPLGVPLGRNVLYVGTMNEDETTQTVSDKVLDRGNVLSFPRPQQLQSRALTAWSPQPVALPADVWRRWIRDPGEVLRADVREQIREALEQINDGLGHVQRAIGHRVLQAIEAYVANHPRTLHGAHGGDAAAGDRSWHSAFEDQLVQKIMPKLRGVEVDSETGNAAIGAVRAVVDQLTPSLSADFTNAASREDGIFAWTTSRYLDSDRVELGA